MAGMLPGVEMHRRIRATSQRLHDDNGICSAHRHHRFYRPRDEPQKNFVAEIDRGDDLMDEAAMKARKRLEEKLGSFGQFRHNKTRRNEGRGTRQTFDTKNTSSHMVTRILLGKPWKFHNNKRDSSKEDLCAVCLGDFGTNQQVTELNCTHKYHSDCLLPWLASHRTCPCCRTPV